MQHRVSRISTIVEYNEPREEQKTERHATWWQQLAASEQTFWSVSVYHSFWSDILEKNVIIIHKINHAIEMKRKPNTISCLNPYFTCWSCGNSADLLFSLSIVWQRQWTFLVLNFCAVLHNLMRMKEVLSVEHHRYRSKCNERLKFFVRC